MIIEFAPLVFGTAALLAIFLFFAVAERWRANRVKIQEASCEASLFCLQ
jgi:hypothetical protein